MWRLADDFFLDGYHGNLRNTRTLFCSHVSGVGFWEKTKRTVAWVCVENGSTEILLLKCVCVRVFKCITLSWVCIAVMDCVNRNSERHGKKTFRNVLHKKTFLSQCSRVSWRDTEETIKIDGGCLKCCWSYLENDFSHKTFSWKTGKNRYLSWNIIKSHADKIKLE